MKSLIRLRGAAWGGACLLWLLTALPGWGAPGELGLRALLIWGTDGSRPTNQKLRELDPELRGKLRAVFKWKDYFEVDRQAVKVPLASKKRVRMSPKCEIEVENAGDSTIEVKLFGEGKLVVKKRQVLNPGELLVLAGEDKNDTAWFVVVHLDPGVR
jgi:hypothetical protein